MVLFRGGVGSRRRPFLIRCLRQKPVLLLLTGWLYVFAERYELSDSGATTRPGAYFFARPRSAKSPCVKRVPAWVIIYPPAGLALAREPVSPWCSFFGCISACSARSSCRCHLDLIGRSHQCRLLAEPSLKSERPDARDDEGSIPERYLMYQKCESCIALLLGGCLRCIIPSELVGTPQAIRFCSSSPYPCHCPHTLCNLCQSTCPTFIEP